MPSTPAYNNATLGQSIFSTGNRVGIRTTSPTHQLTVNGSGFIASGLAISGSLILNQSGIFASGIRLGSSSVSGMIVGLSTTGTVPAIIFDTVGNNHGNSEIIYDFRENGTSLINIDGIGNLSANAGNFVSTAVNIVSDNGAIIGHGIRRRLTNAGMEFVWGESITSTTEPGVDFFPIGGTHISSGILFRLSKDSSKADVAMLINGSGNVGVGTSSPTAKLHVNGSGFIASGLAVSGLLSVNGTGISVSGHTHTSSNITDFNSTVSGLLPVKDIVAGTNVTVSSSSGIYTINSTAGGGGGGGGVVITNSGDNRILTSTGSTSGINGESNLTFNGSFLTVSGSGYFTNGCDISGILNAQVIRQPIVSGTDAATITFDMNQSNVHTVRLGGNRTLAVTNVSVGQRFTIRLKQDTTPPRTVTWFSGVYWPSNRAPILTRVANAVDVFSFICTASGKYDGYIVGYNFPNA